MSPLSRDENLYSLMFDSNFYTIFSQQIFKEEEEEEETSRENEEK